MTIKVITAPTIEPITRTDAKLHLREDGSDQDSVIDALIQAAREYAEAYTGRAFITQTLEYAIDAFTPYIIEIPRPPCQSIVSIKYDDANGDEQTVAAADYVLDTYREPARVQPAYGESWPSIRSSNFNPIRIRFISGYAPIGSPPSDDYADNVPESIKQWMRVRVAQLYEHREAIVTGTIVANIPRDYVDGLLDPYRVRIFA